MSLSHQSILIDGMEILLFLWWEMRKKKKKEKSNPCWKWNSTILFVSLFTSKWRDELMYFLLDLIPSGLTGLEPAASALTGRCSNQLNYNPQEIKCRVYILLWLHLNHFFFDSNRRGARVTEAWVIYWYLHGWVL